MNRNNQKYLIEVWDKIDDSNSNKKIDTRTVCGDGIFDEIDRLKEKNALFAVHQVGECLLDWS